MFINKFVFDKLISAYEVSATNSRKDTENALGQILKAKDSEVSAVIKAKDDQLRMMVAQLSDSKATIEREKARAEAAIDSLLKIKSDVAPIRMADLQREIAAKDAATPEENMPSELRQKELKRIFSEMNGVLEDEPEEHERKDVLTSINGAAV